jgi:twitching motility protein PilT
MEILELLEKTVQNNASDLHLVVGDVPAIRIDGRLTFLNTYPQIEKAEMETMIASILTSHQKEFLVNNRSLDFSYAYGGGNFGDRGRFRVNCYYQRGTLAAAFRLLPTRIRWKILYVLSSDDAFIRRIAHFFYRPHVMREDT